MYIPKRYGESKRQTCPFCDRPSTTTTEEGIPVCEKHRNESVGLLKCLCGETLDVRSGKWGPYGVCMRCGNISWAKILSCNNIRPRSSSQDQGSSQVRHGSEVSQGSRPRQQKARRTYNPESERQDGKRKEIVLTSDEVDFYC